MRLLLIACLTLMVSASYAQSSKETKRKKSSSSKEGNPTSLEPYYPQNNYAPAKKSTKRKDSAGPTYESQKEYQERMARLDKTHRKNERMMEKPQYSDPMYFGHKRPPKKHKAGKLKYCKECGIRH
jgi:Tfp pilus assembly protein PilE